MSKPEFLYHGSPVLVSVLEPGDSLLYAAAHREICIPFALAIRADDKGRSKWRLNGTTADGSTPNPRLVIEQGWLDTNGIGYLYRVPAAAFEERRWQWVSREAVTPIDHEVIRSADYVGWIESGEIR